MNALGTSSLARAGSTVGRLRTGLLVAGLAVVGLLAYLQGAAPGTAPAAGPKSTP